MFRRKKAQSTIEYVVIFCVVFLGMMAVSTNRGIIGGVRQTLDNYFNRAVRSMTRTLN